MEQLLQTLAGAFLEVHTDKLMFRGTFTGVTNQMAHLDEEEGGEVWVRLDEIKAVRNPKKSRGQRQKAGPPRA